MNLDYYLTIGLFNETNLEFITSEIIENITIIKSKISEETQFFKSIPLKDEISVFGYRLDNTSYNIYIQIKNIIYNDNKSKFEIVNYLELEKIKLNNNSSNEIDFYAYYYMINMLKINEHRFILTAPSQSNNELFLAIFDINHELPDISLFIRYYKIPMKIYFLKLHHFLECQNYNGFIAIIYTTYLSPVLNKVYQFLSIFSYINGTDSELINLQKETKLKLKDYINETSIENNIFGVYLYGIKIIKLPNNNENGVFYISKEKNNIIKENDILNSEDEIIFIYDYDDLIIGNTIYIIEIAGVVKEPLYSEAINYSIYNEHYGNALPETFYQLEILIGKTCFYNYSIPNKIITENDCPENCKLCYYNICFNCKNDYILENSTKSCQLNISKEGYYYDENLKYYKKCYESCKTCSKGPKYLIDKSDIEEMNCNKCPQDFYKLENTNNCYNKNNPPKYHFFNIEGFSKCYETCLTCNGYKINSTYYNCLSCDENYYLFYQKSTNYLVCAFTNK